jgi:hypothetical protein
VRHKSCKKSVKTNCVNVPSPEFLMQKGRANCERQLKIKGHESNSKRKQRSDRETLSKCKHCRKSRANR